MNFKIHEGDFGRMGVTKTRESVIFTFAGEKEDSCTLVLVDKDTKEKVRIPVPEEYCMGSLRSVAVCGLKISQFYYYYELNGREVLDDYASVIAGREVWNDQTRREKEYRVYGAVQEDSFDWKGDCNPEIKRNAMFMYKLHVRGFTMDRGAAAATAGTFQAVESKIAYLRNLGVTTVELMPVYEFEEIPFVRKKKQPEYIPWKEEQEDLIRPPKEERKYPRQLNFWGYGPGNYFAVKASYAKNPQKASDEFKHLVHALHTKEMECVMEMYFPRETNHNLILDALRYWVREYHIDGFHLLGENLPMTAILQDVVLSRTKIFYMEDCRIEQAQKKYERFYIYKEEYQYPARKILNHINADMQEFLNQQKKQGDTYGFVNFIASNNGLTLADVFMYNDKHNEANGENNEDGDTWNFSSNYGVEGPTRRRNITAMREQQWRNAMIMLFMGQGVPLIWSGDEFGNSQQGNNNAYCQDNPVGWVNWRSTKSLSRRKQFIHNLCEFRREHMLLSQEKPFHLSDYRTLGFPDLSYHGQFAWAAQVDPGRLSIGLLYSSVYAQKDEECEDVYVAYNFYAYKIMLALPRLAKKRKWHIAIDSADKGGDWVKDPVRCEQQKYVTVEPQSICVLVGK